jgi:hypothetical protein
LTAQDGVKFAPPLINPAGFATKRRQPSKTADLKPTYGDDDSATKQPNCEYKTQSDIITIGSHTGYPRRPITDRTKALDLDQVRLLANAHAFADSPSVQRPLNALVTIVCRHSRSWSGPECWSAQQSRLLDQVTRWLKRKGIETDFVWTRETVQEKGPHTHVLIHLGRRPDQVRIQLTKWLGKAFEFEPDGVDVSCGVYGAQKVEMRAGMLRHILKGFDHRAFRYVGYETANVAVDLGFNHRGQQGTVAVKRSGASENIGLSARRANGWRDDRSIEEIADLLNPTSPGRSLLGLA